MFKKHIKYKDFDGNNLEGDFYFHLTKAELMEWLTSTGTYTIDKMLIKISEEGNNQQTVGMFKDLIKRSYGVKSVDSKEFNKSKELVDKFMYSDAYSEMFMWVCTSDKAAAEFINGIMPDDISEDVNRILSENPEGLPDALKEYAKK